jgi:hypothetical protein
MRSSLMLLSILASALGAQGSAPSITHRLTIGCESCDGPLQFGSIWDVSVNARGEILVTDRDAPMLRRFDVTGKPVWTGGVKGKGPGEYTLPIRAALTSQGMIVVDMTNSRVTDLADNGTVRTSFPVRVMPMVAATGPRGDLWVGNDDFRGTLRVFRRERDSLVEALSLPGSRANVGLAVAPDGSLAAMLDTKKYEIVRVDSRGVKLSPIVREIPQVRRTPAEEAQLRDRMKSVAGMAAAESKVKGVKPAIPVFRPDELSFKDHLTIDGLRFDPSGRLWVMTQRGNDTSTVLDVFAPTGALLGSVTIPMKITGFSLAGSYLATGGENADGVPVATLWTVK